jgi:hypothetical protein
MLPATEETAFFDSCRQALIDEHSGKFAVVCGRRLVGVHTSLDLAMKAAAEAFDCGALTDGAPVLINEIGEAPTVRVVAQSRRAAR